MRRAKTRVWSVEKQKLGLMGKINAYQLETNVMMLVLLAILSVFALWAYSGQEDQNGFGANLWLALATSVMASFLVLICETWVKYRSHQSDLFLEGIERLGIANLHFDKSRLLSNMLQESRVRFWGVGYRLILTSELASDIRVAVSRNGVEVRLLVVGPWQSSFRLVYGENERVAANYLDVFEALWKGASGVMEKISVRGIDKPIFNDTYKIDDSLVTGPYMHNQDDEFTTLAAKDFFTYELHRSSQLYDLIEDEFIALWDDADSTLDWRRYEECREGLIREDLTDRELSKRLSDLFVDRKSVESTEAHSSRW